MTLDLVTLTISQGFADNLSEIEQQVSNYIAEKRGAALAKVVSAVELNESTQKSLKAALKNKLGRDVELSLKVDTSVIGGIKVSIGERTFDGLLSSKFSDIKTVLEGR
jgi:F-type H+-transporting ATPase subunit delta